VKKNFTEKFRLFVIYVCEFVFAMSNLYINSRVAESGGKMPDPDTELSKISDTDSRLLNVNEVWLSTIF